MRPESQKLLLDMLEAAKAIREFVRDKTVADFKQDALLRSGIYFNFIVIGEALSQLKRFDEQIAEQIGEHTKIVGFRNQIVHGYSRLDDEITWRIIETDLSTLQSDIESLMQS
jgi:uncharacterized protein with HEPN domain